MILRAFSLALAASCFAVLGCSSPPQSDDFTSEPETSGGSSSGGSGSSHASGTTGSSSGGGTGSVPLSTFAGTYSCAVSTTADVTQPALGNRSGDGTGAVVIRQSGSTLSATISGSAGVTCTVDLTATGNGAILNPGQRCAAESSLTATITEGAVAFVGGTLDGHFEFGLSGTDQGETVVGSGTETASCTKQ